MIPRECDAQQLPHVFHSSGFTTCRPLFPQFGYGFDKKCSEPYTSALPELTTPITASVIYYETWGQSDGWAIGFTTTTVLSYDSEGRWPILLPAQTEPTGVSTSHFVIRWREGDFSGDDPSSPSDSAVPDSPLPLPSPTPPTTTALLPSQSATGSPVTGQPPPSPWPRGAIVGLVIAAIASALAFGFGLARLRKRRRRARQAVSRAIELDRDPGDGIGFRVLHPGNGPSAEMVE